MDSEAKLISYISHLNILKETLNSNPDPWEWITLITQTIYHVRSMGIDFDSQPETETELMSLTAQTVACFKSMDLDSQPEPLKKLISLISKELFFATTSDTELESEPEGYDLESIPELDLDLDRIPEVDWVTEFEPKPDPRPELIPLVNETMSLEPQPELISLIQKIISHVESIYSNPDLKLKSLLTQLIFVDDYSPTNMTSGFVRNFISLSTEIISLVSSMDFESQPKPESELMSLTAQTLACFKSMDMDSQPESLRDLMTLIARRTSFVNVKDSYPKLELETEFLDIVNKEEEEEEEEKDEESQRELVSQRRTLLDFLRAKFFILVRKTLSLEPEPKLISLIHRIFSIVMSTNSKWKNLLIFCPQVQVTLEEDGKFHVIEESSWTRNDRWERSETSANLTSPEREALSSHLKLSCRNKNWDCLPFNWDKFKFHGENKSTHFLCRGCYGENHDENSKVPSLVLSVDQPKWHEHTLHLFPSQAPLTCSLCALTHSNSPFYICPPCDFLVHQKCLSLPHLIRISRHPHRISFIHSFQKGDWFCYICRRKINNDYGGYYCIKKDCSYAAHSKCATQPNVWDGRDLEGLPEEETEELEPPFKTISDGIIQHFSHDHHHLRLDENTNRDYDDKKLCQACITPIYFGNFYSCLQCDFILHQDCANLPRKIHHPLHPHMLTLVTNKPVRRKDIMIDLRPCSACPQLCMNGFFYECSKRRCRFVNYQLHAWCAKITEPLVHPSHKHDLFLTSKPDEERICSVCKKTPSDCNRNKETFNCIEECEFALCFECASLPQKVRYKHDKHILTLSYGDKSSTNWCEACETKINLEEGFYNCDEYCCVNLHISCMLGMDLYVQPSLPLSGSSWLRFSEMVLVLPNHMSRPICSSCKNRCPHKIVFQLRDFVFCTLGCILND